jgi:dTDP-L-rhamnose 4-epimerase
MQESEDGLQMRVLITGGAGFIGSHLAERFLKEGYRVRILDNLDSRVHPTQASAFIPHGAEFIRGDVTDRECLERALKGVDIISHHAAYQDYMLDFSKFFAVNTVSTALLYEIIVARQLPIRQVIVASSQAVYGEGQYLCPSHGLVLPPPRKLEQLTRGEWEVCCPVCASEVTPLMLDEKYTNPYNPYGVSKYAGERAALGLGCLHNIPTVILRYSITQGKRQSLYNHYSGICRIFVSHALTKKPLLIYEDGLQTRDFVHIDDVVEANLTVLQNSEADFQIYNVGSGVTTTVQDYADAVKKRLGEEVQSTTPGQYRRGDNRHSVSSIEKLKKLGWRPKRDLEHILDDFLAWIDSIGGIPDRIPDAYQDMRRVGVVLSAAAS